jgi:serine/threonine-protein kinase
MGRFVQAGDVLDGKYAVDRVIGRGGVGYVVAARHLVLEQSVALKFLLPELEDKPDIGRRFLREARAAARMRGAHAVRVLDADSFQSGQPYLVMEYLEGEDLAALLRRRGPLPVAEACDYLLQACEAVAEAHALRILHRDIKPSNLFLARAPNGAAVLKVLDFGLSKLLGDEVDAGSLTDSHRVIGSPHFMSPEQIRTPREVDERADVWGLGATLFTLLSGQVPFAGQSMIEVCGALLCGPPPQLSRFRADVPPELEAVVLRCLTIDVHERIASAADLARALGPFAPRGEGATAIAATASGAVALVHEDSAPPLTQPPRARGRWSFRVAGAAGLAAVATLALVGLVATRSTFHPSPASPVLAASVQAASLPLAVDAIAEAPPAISEAPPAASGAGSPAPVPIPSASGAVEPARVVPAGIVPAGGAAHRRPVPVGAGASLTAAALAPLPAAPSPPSTSTAEPPRKLVPPGCEQPFFIDRRGIKSVRPECL